MKVNKKFNGIFYIILAYMLVGCTKYPDYEVTRTPYVNYSSLEIYIGETQNLDATYMEEAKQRGMFIEGKVQMAASPGDVSYTWQSADNNIAKVSTTGLIEGVAEGLTTVYCSSEGMENARIDIRVRPYIPCTDFQVSRDNVMIFPKGKIQLYTFSQPEDATGPCVWTSSDIGIATVFQDGVITGNNFGATEVKVKIGNVEKTIAVSIPNLEICDKTTWSVVAWSDAHTEGGGINTIIDGNYATNNYWHSYYGSPNAALPHWAVIDMKEPVTIARIVTRRRNNGDTKTIEYYTGDEADANASTWKKITQGNYPQGQNSVIDLTLDATERLTGRYLKLIVSDSYRIPFTAITEIDVYRAVFD
ncbi:MAG: Ig-like domain-containing protein [Tannerella sp.]|nr:Ig-like domain-containing protein [Tannerella sp.]